MLIWYGFGLIWYGFGMRSDECLALLQLQIRRGVGLGIRALYAFPAERGRTV